MDPDSYPHLIYLCCLQVCHTVIPEGPPEASNIKYEAESPDEAALVVGAKALGFLFHRRSNKSIRVSY